MNREALIALRRALQELADEIKEALPIEEAPPPPPDRQHERQEAQANRRAELRRALQRTRGSRRRHEHWGG